MNENQDSVFEPMERPAPMSADSLETEPKAEPDGGSYDRPMRKANDSFARPKTKSSYTGDPDAFYFSSKPPRKKHTGLLVCLGCLLLALLAAGGWWLLNHFPRDPMTNVKMAAGNTLDAYLDYMKDLPNLHRYTENSIAFFKSDNKHLEMNVSIDGSEGVPGYQAQLRLDRDGKAKTTLLHGYFEGNQMSIPIDIYVDQSQIQIASSTVLEEGEALALPVKDFGKKWNSSVLASSDFSGKKLPEDFSLSFLTDGVSEQTLKDAFGADWTNFAKSISCRKATAEDGESCFSKEGEIYILSWDQALLSQLGTRARVLLNTTSNTSDLGKLLPATVINAFEKVSEKICAPHLLVSDDMLLGISVQMADSKQTIVIELVGEDNPCSRCVASMLQQNHATQKMEVVQTMEASLIIANGQLRMKLTQSMPNSGKTNVLMESVYNDADGEMSIANSSSNSGLAEMPQGMDTLNSLMKGIKLYYTPTENGCRMSYSLDLGGMLGNMNGASSIPVPGKISFSFEFGSGTKSIQPLSQKPTQILDLDKTAFSLLVTRIENRLSGLSSSFHFD